MYITIIIIISLLKNDKAEVKMYTHEIIFISNYLLKLQFAINIKCCRNMQKYENKTVIIKL